MKNIIETIQLPLLDGEQVRSTQLYRVDTKIPRKWQFWLRERVKFNIAVMTTYSRFFIIDPDNITVREKPN